MKKVLYYVLRIVVIIYATANCSLILSGIVLTFSEKEYSFIGILIIGALLFTLFIFLDRKLKSKIKKLHTQRQTISNFNKSNENTYLLSNDSSIENSFNKIYIEKGHTVSHADGSSITEEEIPYLIEHGYQKALGNERNSPNPAFHRTEREEDLSVNFMMGRNYEEAKKRISKFENLEQQALNESDYEKKIILFNQALTAFEKAKSFCYRTKGGMIWFQDMYEYLHNSQNPCFSYADTIKNRIEYYTEIHSLELQINSFIEDNKGYLQKDLYKLFPNSSRGDVQRAVKNLVENNVIEKTKQGSTYQLTIKGE